MGLLKKLTKGKSSGSSGKKGRFMVYVGPKKQQFMVKTECANHPLFAKLLEEAASEYGYQSDGPITLPCDVDFFYKVVAQMQQEKDSIITSCDCDDDDDEHELQGGFGEKAFSPTRWWRMKRLPRDVDGSGSSTPYGLLTPLRSFQH